MAAGSGSPAATSVADRDIEGEHGAGEGRGAGEGHSLAAHLDVERAQPPEPVAGPGQRHGVADEDQPAGGLARSMSAPQPGMDVDAIGDELDEGRASSSRAASASPGARWSSPVIALNRWVVPVAPAA